MVQVNNEIHYVLEDFEETVKEVGYILIPEDQCEEIIDELNLHRDRIHSIVIADNDLTIINLIKSRIRAFSHRYSIKKRKNFAIFINYT